MRQAAQCMGRALRGKSDYGLMVFADKVNFFVSLLLNFKICVTINLLIDEGILHPE